MLFYSHSSRLCPVSSLDTIGLAGFSHDFGSLEGKTTAVATVLDTLGSFPSRSVINASFFILSQVFTALVYFPTKRNVLMQEIQQELSKISEQLLDKEEERESSRHCGWKIGEISDWITAYVLFHWSDCAIEKSVF